MAILRQFASDTTLVGICVVSFMQVIIILEIIGWLQPNGEKKLKEENVKTGKLVRFVLSLIINRPLYKGIFEWKFN